MGSEPNGRSMAAPRLKGRARHALLGAITCLIVGATAAPAMASSASIGGVPASAIRGQSITPVAQNVVVDAGCVANEYLWFYDSPASGTADETTSTPTASAVSFSTVATHTVRLRVTEVQDQADTANVCPNVDVVAPAASVDVVNLKPNAPTINAFTNPATANSPVTFSGTLNGDPDGDNPVSIVGWTFGNGIGSSSDSPTYQYPAAGTYTVTLTVQDSLGARNSSTAQITVNPANHAPVCRSISAVASTPHTLTFISSCADADAGETASLGYSWNFGDGTVLPGAASAAHRYTSPGTKTVTVTATDINGASDSSFDSFSPPNGSPTAQFDASPNIVGPGGTVTLNAQTSTDPDGDVLTYGWDLNNDGTFTDAAGPSLTTTFPTTGTKTIRVRVTDGWGGSSTATQFVTVSPNNPPTPAFTFAPVAPLVGQAVTFTSTTAPGGAPLSGLVWDLNNDGQFDDASGPTAQAAFSAPGIYTVRLMATDANFPGGVVTFQRVSVSAPPPAAPTAGPTPITEPIVQAAAKLSLLQPVPIVRIRGQIVRNGVRITLLSVQAPKGATVKVVCKGKGCPKPPCKTTGKGKSRKRVCQKVASTSQTVKTGGVRFKTMQRTLSSGATVEVYVTKPGSIGKYTRFRIRKGKAPARRDACVMSGSTKSIACPSG
ncbi:PKD domain-containing protein [Baekduia soli]|uniref:PKD domain-containing protein n=1 Tax=Baekduia soli TaxID=496014 RepID=A0A5B8U7M5_9ACTN|nr:PKD domain-containing protein [Baekduia soli]QEC49129.1 PKD domain-containing protein [Baekduia soli]